MCSKFYAKEIKVSQCFLMRLLRVRIWCLKFFEYYLTNLYIILTRNNTHLLFFFIQFVFEFFLELLLLLCLKKKLPILFWAFLTKIFTFIASVKFKTAIHTYLFKCMLQLIRLITLNPISFFIIQAILTLVKNWKVYSTKT